jgi:autotransporter adhesin
VNVSQLKAVEATANKGWNLTTNGKPESKSNVKPGDTVDFANEDGNVKIENKGNNVIVNLNKDIDLTKDGSVTIGDTKVNNDGLTIAGGPSVTKSGIDAGDKKITNVAPGKISADSKDAINGSQLYTVQQAAVAAKTEVKAGDNVEVKKESGGNGQDIYTVSAKDTSASVTAGSDAITVNKADPKKVGTVDVTDYKVDLSQATKDNIQKGVDAKGIVDNKGLTFAGDNNSSTEVQKLGSTVNVNGDSNITTQASGNTVKVTLNPNVTVESLTATNSVKVGSGGAQVALTTNVGKDGVRELSVGSANAPTRITNVARGVNDTDAVNLSQLKDLGYNINTKIDKVEKEANAGIASAMAMETAPFIAGKWTYAVGAAYYGGEQAVGATLRKTADNGRWSLTGGVATGTEGDPSVRIGISGVID